MFYNLRLTNEGLWHRSLVVSSSFGFLFFGLIVYSLSFINVYTWGDPCLSTWSLLSPTQLVSFSQILEVEHNGIDPCMVPCNKPFCILHILLLETCQTCPYSFQYIVNLLESIWTDFNSLKKEKKKKKRFNRNMMTIHSNLLITLFVITPFWI